MDKLAALRIYGMAYRAKAHQLATGVIARQWMETMGDVRAATRDELVAHAEQSAQWANLGYTPREAAPLIADRVTPEQAAEMDQLADDIAGGPDERATRRIDQLVADGVLVDPRRVSWREDPDDPTHIIVDIRPEQD